MTSILDPTGHELARILGASRVSRLHVQWPIWEIQSEGLLATLIRWIGREPGHPVPYDVCRVLLLTKLLNACGRTFLSCPENPTEFSPHFRAVDTNMWEVPYDVDVAELHKFLDMDAWCMAGQHRHDVDFDFPKLDLFRLKRVDFVTVMRESNAAYLLDAFHDNEPWRLAINPDLGNSVR